MLFDDINLDAALESGQFVPYFQPLVDAAQRHARGIRSPRTLESSACRARHAERLHRTCGTPKAGSCELMRELLRAAFLRMAQHPQPLILAVNVSPVQLRDLTVAKQIRATADQTGFSLDRLMVEITESALTPKIWNRRCSSRASSNRWAAGWRSTTSAPATPASCTCNRFPSTSLKVDRSFVGFHDHTAARAAKSSARSSASGRISDSPPSPKAWNPKNRPACSAGWGATSARAGFTGGPCHPISSTNSSAATPPGRPRLPQHPAPQPRSRIFAVCPASGWRSCRRCTTEPPSALGLVNTQMRYVNLNHRLADMNGFTVEEHIGRHVTEIIPELAGPAGDALRRSLAGEVMSAIEINLHNRHTGSPRTVLLSYQPVRDEANEVIGVLALRSRHQRAQTRRRGPARKRRSLPPYCRAQPPNSLAHGRRRQKHRGEPALGRRPPDSRASRPAETVWMDALHPDDRERITPIIEDCPAHPEADRRRISRSPAAGVDGSGCGREARRGSTPQGNIFRWYGSVEDIDQRKRTEEELRASETRLQAVFDSVPVGIILADAPEGTLRMANPEARRLVGRSRSARPQQPKLPRIGGRSRPAARCCRRRNTRWRAQLRGETTHYDELLCQFADGSRALARTLRSRPSATKTAPLQEESVVVQDTDAARRELKRLLTVAEAVVNELKART